MIRFLLLMAIIGHSLVAAAAETDAAPTEQQAHPDPVMEKLIQRVEEQERRYDRMEVTLQRSTELLDKKWTIPKSVETIRTVRQPELFFAERNRVDHILDGTKKTDRSVVFHDGKTTTAIEYDNSVNVLHFRYEPAFVFPPHTWSIYHPSVKFPLSVYLKGTQAMQAFRKTRQLPVRTNSYFFGINFAESEFLGEVAFEGLKCEKIKILQRYREKDPPAVQILWLAKEHNYLCVKSQTLTTINGVDHVWTESKIDALRELDEGLFIPQKVSVERYDHQALIEGKKEVDAKFSLLVKSANASPTYSSEELAPDVPEDIPSYEISEDQHLINSPHHPTPTRKTPSTSLDKIITAVRQSEKKYQNIDLSLLEEYLKTKRENASTEDGMISMLQSKTESRTISSLGRHYYFEDKFNSMDDGIDHRFQKTQLYDGKIVRSVRASDWVDPKAVVISSAIVSFAEEPNLETVRPHMMLIRSLRDYRPLSTVLESGWYDYKKSDRMTIRDKGDENIDGELCHKLRRDLVPSKSGLHQFLWISPNKNYLPIRSEWHRSRKEYSLPNSIDVVTSLKEVASGVWVPMTVRSATFQWAFARGMSEGRLTHQWQQDFTVKNVSLSPIVDDKLFSELIVPAGIKIAIRDTDGKRLGSITQLKEGSLQVTEEQLGELKEE